MLQTIKIKGELLSLESPKVMGILNITPDSFYENSRKQTEKQIIEKVQQFLNEGATFIDVGAQSTRLTSILLSAQEEIKRLSFALGIINKEFPNALLSLDTFYSEVAKMGVEKYGVSIINDISGGEIDKNMFETIANLDVPYILMHMKGTPQTMQSMANYNDLCQEIFIYFSEKIAQLQLLGVKDIILDPGFGFSKTLDQNYELMGCVNNFNIFELPLLVGISRKSMLYRFLNISIEECLNATTVLNTYALMNGANILRVHDVKEAVETIRLVNKIKQNSNQDY